MLKRIFILSGVFFVVWSCNCSLSDKEKNSYETKGKEIAQASFTALSTELTKQMKAGGPALAIPFCNAQAMPITEELSEKYNVTIKRTSDKIRNPQNSPSKRELEVIEKYKSQIGHENFMPIVEKNDAGNVQFYAPIVVKDKCLACHGTIGENVAVKTDSIIKSLYVNDKATGYEAGDIRGIWSIEFN